MTVSRDDPRGVSRTSTGSRLLRNPKPATVWASVTAVLLGLELGAVLEFAGSITLDSVPTLNGIACIPLNART